MLARRAAVFPLLALIGGLAAVILTVIPASTLNVRTNLMLNMAFPILYGLFVLGLIALYARVRDHVERAGRVGFWAALIGLILMGIGAVANAWLLGPTSDALAFVGSLGGLVAYMMGCLMLGIDAMKERWHANKSSRLRAMPIPVGVVLILGGMLGLAASFTIVPYIPDGFTFGIGLSWLVIGGVLLLTRNPATPDPNAPPISGWWG